MDYWDIDVQEQIENLTKTFESSRFISSPLYTESWVRSFVNYVNRNQEELNVTIDTKESFLETLNDVRFIKLYREKRTIGVVSKLTYSFVRIVLAVVVQTEPVLVRRQVQ